MKSGIKATTEIFRRISRVYENAYQNLMVKNYTFLQSFLENYVFQRQNCVRQTDRVMLMSN